MNPNPLPIPHLDPLPLPAPGGLLWFLLMLTFFLHLVPMNFVLGGSVIAALARWRGSRPDGAHARALAGWMARAMPIVIAAAVSFGVAPLLFVQTLYGRLFFTGSVIMAWFWLAVIPLLILAYYGAYLLAFRGDRLGGAGTAVAGVVALFFVIIGFLYTNNMTLMLRPEKFAEKYLHSGAGWQLNLDDPTVIPRFLHMFLGALAVTGMAIAHLGLARRRKDPAFGAWAVRHGVWWFLGPTLFNFVVGLWWLGVLPREVMFRFMGKSMVATAALGIGILLGLVSLVVTAMALYAPDPSRPLRISGAALVLTLIAMILARDEVRQASLARAGFAVNPWVEPAWGVIAIFAVLLVAALASIVWMIRAMARAKPEGSGS